MLKLDFDETLLSKISFKEKIGLLHIDYHTFEVVTQNAAFYMRKNDIESSIVKFSIMIRGDFIRLYIDIKKPNDRDSNGYYVNRFMWTSSGGAR